MPICVMLTCVRPLCVMPICVMPLDVIPICVTSIRRISLLLLTSVVGCDRSPVNFSGSHLLSQVKSVCQSSVFKLQSVMP